MAQVTVRTRGRGREEALQESYFVASQWQLMWRKFRKHRLAILGGVVLILIYGLGIFAEFFSPYDKQTRHRQYTYAPPQRLRFVDTTDGFRLRLHVYGWKRTRDPETLEPLYEPDPAKRYTVKLFTRGWDYKLLGLFSTNVHFFGVEEGSVLFLFGSDEWGRDLYSRILHAGRISLSVGLLGIAISFVLGCLFGGISGYFGGTADMIIQRIIEFLISIPTIPLWMGLAAALPLDWPPIKVYFAITVILALRGWTGLARVVRGKLLSLREEDFVLAARIAGAREGTVIVRHLLPSFLSYLIVSLTLSIPYMILGETSLSFLGLGLRPPAVSWGVLLQQAQNIRAVALNPWLLIPGLFVVVAVLAFNFLGDGLRDAADPYR
jgi:peptide/nickel transport system permease protein